MCDVEEVEWNDGYYLESMDRIHTIQIMAEELLNGHPAILKLKCGEERLELIQDMLYDLYQDIGKMEFEETGKW